MTTPAIRRVLSEALGQTLTPELAASIEMAGGVTAQLPDFIDPETGGFLVAREGPEAIDAWILKTVQAILSLPEQSRIDFQMKHTFVDGMYSREMFIPKGSLVVGKIHKKPCLNFVSKGDISILTTSGTGRVTAGHSSPSYPGTQKIGYAHEDTVFVNVFRQDETSIEDIDDVLAFSTAECIEILAKNGARRLT